jgi:hypothetical protein
LRWTSGEESVQKRVGLKVTEGSGLGEPRLATVPTGFIATLEPGPDGYLIVVEPQNRETKQRASLNVVLNGVDGKPTLARVQLIVD